MDLNKLPSYVDREGVFNEKKLDGTAYFSLHEKKMSVTLKSAQNTKWKKSSERYIFEATIHGQKLKKHVSELIHLKLYNLWNTRN